MKRVNKQSGYIGILLILLGTAGMVFLFMKMYFTPTQTTTTGELWLPEGPGSAPTTQYDRLRSDIDAANAVSNQMNTKALETNSVLNSLK